MKGALFLVGRRVGTVAECCDAGTTTSTTTTIKEERGVQAS